MMSDSLSLNNEASLGVTENITSSIRREVFSFVWSISQFGKFLDRKYEFSSPIFSQKTPDTSKWKLTVFPENNYPRGLQVALRIHNASSDSRCYSVQYTAMLIDRDGKHLELQTREKVFRYYLDYDECPLTSNQQIKEQRLLQNDDTLTICCKLDILLCNNQNIKSSDSVNSPENISVSSEKQFLYVNADRKSSECATRENNLSPEDYYPRENSIEILSEDGDNFLNTCQQVDPNFQRTPKIKKEKHPNSKNEYKRCSSRVVHVDQGGKSLNNLPERVNSEKGKLTTDSNFKIPKNFEILSNDLSFLFTTKYQYDVTVHTNDGRIRAHKAILAARSNYFRRTLTPGDDDIHTRGINTTTMNAVLLYMYSGQKPQMTFDLAMNVLTACDTFHLKHLGEMAQDSLKSQVNANNVTDILRKAKELKLDDLKISALQFVSKNREAVIKTPKWSQMIDSDPHSAGEILLTIAAFHN